MKKFVPLLAAIIMVSAFASVSEAACGLFGGWYPGKRVAQNIAARRDAGEGLFQENGPGKRLVRGRR